MATFERLNVVRHTWEVSDDVVVCLTVESRSALAPEAYPAIADVVAAGDLLAASLKGLDDEAAAAGVEGQS